MLLEPWPSVCLLTGKKQSSDIELGVRKLGGCDMTSKLKEDLFGSQEARSPSFQYGPAVCKNREKRGGGGGGGYLFLLSIFSSTRFKTAWSSTGLAAPKGLACSKTPDQWYCGWLFGSWMQTVHLFRSKYISKGLLVMPSHQPQTLPSDAMLT